jgi:uncharacterized membrane protein
MNKALLLLVVLATSAFASELLTINIERSGIASVILSLEGEHSSAISLPSDASNFRIVGGSFSVLNGTAQVTPGPSGFTTFSFSSSVLTTKTPDGWKLFFEAPSTSNVTLYMPAYAVITSSSPKPMKVSADESRPSLEFSGGPIALEYELSAAPEPVQSDSSFILIAAFVLAAGMVAAAIILRNKPHGKTVREKTPSLLMTGGKKEMMETFNENDKAIVGFLLSSQGKSKRNELERKTGISKSSLAKAINRLEKRKIIEIDRTSTTHFVKLSEYFLKL